MNTLNQWATFIAAVAAAVVSIINAWRGNQLAQKLEGLRQSVAASRLPAARDDRGRFCK